MIGDRLSGECGLVRAFGPMDNKWLERINVEGAKSVTFVISNCYMIFFI